MKKALKYIEDMILIKDRGRAAVRKEIDVCDRLAHNYERDHLQRVLNSYSNQMDELEKIKTLIEEEDNVS